MASVRKTLQDARKEKKWTQGQVAGHIGISVSLYQKIELAQRIGKPELWDNLEKLFGIHQTLLREVSTD